MGGSRFGFLALLVASILIGAGIVAYYADNESQYVSTDYAYVQAPVAQVSAPASGTLVSLTLPLGKRLDRGQAVAGVRTPAGTLRTFRLAMSGTVTAAFATIGDTVTQGQVLGQVAALQKSVVVAEVPENEAHRLALGQHVDVRLPDDPGTASGRLVHIGRATLSAAATAGMPALTTANATQYVPITIDFRKGGLRVINGMSASVRVHA